MKKKVLFIDRDGTIIKEPPTDFQVDSLEKLEFIPKAISNLRKLTENCDYELVMVTNQDGLGTDSFPEKDFWPAQYKMLKTLEQENIQFAAIHIDRSFEEEQAPTRKPRIGMLTSYFSEDYDLSQSFVIGDRATDIQLAQNLGTKSIFFGESHSEATFCCKDWDEIYTFLALPPRQSEVNRKTAETDIYIKLNLDGTGACDISTGLHFFDHMLEQLGKHGSTDLRIQVKGDLHIDEHHTIEDTALALGEAYAKALGDKKGIYRYGFLLPMDDSLAQVALDFGGRPWLEWDAQFSREKVGDMPTELFFHFFKSFSDAAKCNLNICLTGDNEHHKIEAAFKGLARAIKMAVLREERNLKQLPSTKGML
ncbi:MAG: bifunctional histidinol-phosphatase/imidazoleglycerol-phosphate dehydratase HisB [Bacteroidetes bacterium]|nr:bifunctional histidinol-phosphatase/imidazoleglycerol-phosphate dehydratase HisB [Bacteroidota bacterium]MDA1269350.1 bifunctional histidinol-phosphatase/imidazoleglycerol-phosphate dehydratase HisB [Bacteroidota bacterium]